MPGQSSFRRVLISRVLLISVPILLIGVACTFWRARTSLLLTANHNLVESATSKAQHIDADVQTLRAILETASQSNVLINNDVARTQPFLDHLQQYSEISIQCVQLHAAPTGAAIASTSTCSDPSSSLDPSLFSDWSTPTSDGITPFHVAIAPVPSSSSPADPVSAESTDLEATVQVPVYNAAGELQSILSATSILNPPESGQPRSFLGYTVLVDLNRRQILSHPQAYPTDQWNVDSLTPILLDADRGIQNFRHVFNFSPDGKEWIAGYVPLTLQTGSTQAEEYAVIAITEIQDALRGLDVITHTIVWVMAGLLGTNLLALLYLAKELADPIEALGQHALRVHQKDQSGYANPDFNIRELSNLAQALDLMMQRLEERATELENAWQEAEAANQLKSEFLANTSHELRTPLNAIIGCVRLIRDGYCDSEEEELEFLDRALDAATHLLKIINDLLDIAKIESGSLAMSLERVNIQTLLQDVVALQAVDIQQKGLMLNAPDLSAPLIVYADAGKLKQVFLNVIFNAIKFTDQGSITIKTRIEPLTVPLPENIKGDLHISGDQEYQQVVVSIIDTGIGIDPAQQHKLFRPFVMVDGSTTRKFEGTGLGLAISRNLIGLMGGDITLSSAGVNQGTTVEIIMPLLNSVPTSSRESNDRLLPSDRPDVRSPAGSSS